MRCFERHIEPAVACTSPQRVFRTSHAEHRSYRPASTGAEDPLVVGPAQGVGDGLREG